MLVWTQSVDPHADLVIRELQVQGARVDRINGDALPGSVTASVEFPGSRLRVAGRELCSFVEQYNSVWYRRRIDPTFSSLIDPAAQPFALQEARAWLDGILLLSRDAFWVNDFTSAHLARNKPYQLSVAERCGLTIPPTLISNDYGEVIAFAERHRKVIYKPVHHGVVPVEGEPDSLVFSTLLSVEHLLDVRAEIELVPGIYQAYVPKNLELRVTIVGDEIFACAIHSQEHERTAIDWRHYHADLRHSVFHLPQHETNQLRVLMQMLGLQFGTIDMILTPSGEYVFLEVNQMGQWLWVQQLTGMPIAKSLATPLNASKEGGTTDERRTQTAGVSVQDS
ncbi:MAG: hypothetical protein U0514_03490 [Candidatus Andersenbacteria bacterium]